MFCMLWVIFQTLAVLVVVEGGISSGSVEALANGGVNGNRVAAAGNNAIASAQNGVPLNGEAIVARLVQIGGSYFIQPVGNPVGQTPLQQLQQLIPITALQQGGVATAGQGNGNLQGQLAQQAGGNPVTLFAVLPQANNVATPQRFSMTQGQLQVVPVVNNQGRAGGVGARFLRSLAARPRGTETAPVRPMGAEEEEEEEEEEENSGDLTEDNQAN